jgi:hypothetical protein
VTPERALEIVRSIRRSIATPLDLKASRRELQIAVLGDKVLRFLFEDGGAHSAQEICAAIKVRDNWDSLRALEKAGLVWRAFDHEDWRTIHAFKITGCGRLTIIAGQGARE